MAGRRAKSATAGSDVDSAGNRKRSRPDTNNNHADEAAEPDGRQTRRAGLMEPVRRGEYGIARREALLPKGLRTANRTGFGTSGHGRCPAPWSGNSTSSATRGCSDGHVPFSVGSPRVRPWPGSRCAGVLRARLPPRVPFPQVSSSSRMLQTSDANWNDGDRDIRIRAPRTVTTSPASSARQCRSMISTIRAMRRSAGTSGRRTSPACSTSCKQMSSPKSVSMVTRI